MKRQKHLDILSPVSVRQKSTPKGPWGHCVLAPLGSLVPGNEEEGLGLVERWSCTSAGPMQNWGSCQTVESCVGLDVGRSSRACTVTPTFTRPRSSRMWCGRHSLSCGTPSFLQASKKFSTFLRHLAMLSFGTAGDGTWMLATDRGQIWLAKWQRTTPSIRAAPTSSGSNTLSLDSMFCRNSPICSISSLKCSIFLLIVKLGSVELISWWLPLVKADLGLSPNTVRVVLKSVLRKPSSESALPLEFLRALWHLYFR